MSSLPSPPSDAAASPDVLPAPAAWLERSIDDLLSLGLSEPAGLPEPPGDGIARRVAAVTDVTGESLVELLTDALRDAQTTIADQSRRFDRRVNRSEAAAAELQRQALSDPLTGLPNRAHFRDYLSDEISRGADGLSVCFIDLDNFKQVNDTAGHKAGDELLCQVARRIETLLPGGSFVSRFGGDEFALILRDADCPVHAIDETIGGLLNEFQQPFELKDAQAVVGMSVGLCRYPRDGRDVETLMKAADIAMYVAKTAGKNRVRAFNAEMQDSVDLRQRVQSRLRAALSSGDLDLHYQSKNDARTGRVVGCESFVRWRTEGGIYIPPSEFIPIAEQTGLIGPLGDLVFQKAIEQGCRWASGGVEPSIGINVSPLQLRDPHFVSRLAELLAAHEAPAEWFELEITEQAIRDDPNRAIAITGELADLGFRIAIDDFGTGLSSLSYLRDFPLDSLKIDLSFVREVHDDPYSQAIIRSVISLGHGLGLTVVAEGVETAEQRRLLTSYGCDVLQGYHFGRPVPAADFTFQDSVGRLGLLAGVPRRREPCG